MFLSKTLWIQQNRDVCMNISRSFERGSFDHFTNIKWQCDFIMAKTRGSTLRLSWPTYDRRGFHVQKNRESLCGIFNSDRSHYKARHAFIEFPNTTKVAYISGHKHSSKFKSLKLLLLFVSLPKRLETKIDN